jgi:Uma2 family endonuclease
MSPGAAAGPEGLPIRIWRGPRGLGNLCTSPPGGAIFHLRTWAKLRGAVVTVESGYILSEEPATVRGPDVAVSLSRRSTEGVPGGWVWGAPDVAVEVLSPSDSASAIHQKTLECCDAGARLVWIVAPLRAPLCARRRLRQVLERAS